MTDEKSLFPETETLEDFSSEDLFQLDSLLGDSDGEDWEALLADYPTDSLDRTESRKKISEKKHKKARHKAGFWL